MELRTHDRLPSADALDFVRFCYRRRRVGWPELYDEMCAVAGRGLYRGWRSDELSAEGIGFSLFEMPALAVLVNRVVTEEHAKRAEMAPPSILRAPLPAAASVAGVPELAAVAMVADDPVTIADASSDVAPSSLLTFAGLPAGA